MATFLSDLEALKAGSREAYKPPVMGETADYKLVVDVLRWAGTVQGDLGYRVINKVTDVCEGEGSILGTALEYMRQLQIRLDEYRDEGFGPKSKDIN